MQFPLRCNRLEECIPLDDCVAVHVIFYSFAHDPENVSVLVGRRPSAQSVIDGAADALPVPPGSGAVYDRSSAWKRRHVARVIARRRVVRQGSLACRGDRRQRRVGAAECGLMVSFDTDKTIMSDALRRSILRGISTSGFALSRPTMSILPVQAASWRRHGFAVTMTTLRSPAETMNPDPSFGRACRVRPMSRSYECAIEFSHGPNRVGHIAAAIRYDRAKSGL